MKLTLLLLASAIAAFASAGETPPAAPALWADFQTPPEAAKPWCYYWWINGHADRETIRADLESMKELGFGGLLLFDSRGYFDNADHVINPTAEIVWGSEKWYELVEFTLRECARLGLTFTMNASASGGWLNGFKDGKEYQVNVLDAKEVREHLERVIGPLLKRAPELVGEGRTFTHIYSVSYEGGVKAGGTWKDIKDGFYATMRQWAHAHGLQVYSESGGPWYWGANSVKLDCTQLDMLAHNDFPQGEFWPLEEYAYGDPKKVRHANANGRFFQRGIVLSARREGRRIASMESFTHMMRHYSVDPALLKPLADITFADGANRIVWHTFTCSPDKFGVPGAEYFAGSHINRNVTWQKDAAPFVKYLTRASALLQKGEYVDDGEFSNVVTNYYTFNPTRYRADPKAPYTSIHRRVKATDGKTTDFLFVAGEGSFTVPLKFALDGRGVEIWDAVTVTRKPAAMVHDCPVGSRVPRDRVALDLPIGGSAFIVVDAACAQPAEPTPEKACKPFSVTGPWETSFAYHPGIKAAPPKPVTFEKLEDWTTRDDLKYFAGTATYRTQLDAALLARKGGKAVLSLGEVPTGTARVFIDGIECGVVWCAPWELDITEAIKGRQTATLEIRYTSNWYNRLVGDCRLPENERVTKSTLRYWEVERKSDPKRPWWVRPTVHSGPSAYDRLQSSGLLGPVTIVFESEH